MMPCELSTIYCLLTISINIYIEINFYLYIICLEPKPKNSRQETNQGYKGPEKKGQSSRSSNRTEIPRHGNRWLHLSQQ